MNTHVVGYRPPDAKYQRMAAVYEACTRAGTSTPQEVLDFFEGEEPSEHGTIVEIESSEYEDRRFPRNGREVDLTTLPKGVTVLRFYNSY